MHTHEHTQHEEPLASEKIKGKHKDYFLDLLQNHRGLCVRITERFGDRKSRVIVSAEDFDDFCQAAQNIEAELRRRL